MKIAITGHSAGIGKALAKQYEMRGHEIVGLSKRYGDNIRNIPKIISKIKDCDMFINNAHTDYCQTDLLYAIYAYWKGKKGKRIVNISSQLTSFPINPMEGNNLGWEQYRTQKIALEDAHKQLLKNHDWPKLYLIKPGSIRTESNPNKDEAADPDVWAEKVVELLEDLGPSLEIYEIAIGPYYG